MDPTNGFTAIHLGILDEIDMDKVDSRYFFESDLLFRLNIARCVVRDIPMKAVYSDEHSGLRITKVLFPFLRGHMRNFMKRIYYNYFLRDFQVASIEFVLGPLLLIFGIIFGLHQWRMSYLTDMPATPGTVMIAALTIILGTQFLLSAINFDIHNTPTDPIHTSLSDAYKEL